jgi:hypothetical protein
MFQQVNVYMYTREQLEPVVGRLRLQGIVNECILGLGSEEAIAKACGKTRIEEVSFEDLFLVSAWGNALSIVNKGRYWVRDDYSRMPNTDYFQVWTNLWSTLATIKPTDEFTIRVCTEADLTTFDDTRGEEPDAVVDEYERDPYEMYGISVPDID